MYLYIYILWNSICAVQYMTLSPIEQSNSILFNCFSHFCKIETNSTFSIRSLWELTNDNKVNTFYTSLHTYVVQIKTS